MPTLPFSTPVRRDLLTVSEAVVALTGLVDGLLFVFTPDQVCDALVRIHDEVGLWTLPDVDRSGDDHATSFNRAFAEVEKRSEGFATHRIGMVFWAHCRSLLRIARHATLREAVGHHVAVLGGKRS